MLKRRSHLILCILTLLLASATACARDETPSPTPTITLSETRQATGAMMPTSTPAPPTNTPAPTFTPTPEPTPIIPQITISDQVLTEDGRLTIDQVISPQDGWLVLLVEQEEELVMLGHTAVAIGENSDLTLTIDPLTASPELTARLHQDTGQTGEFDFPEADEPIMEDDEAVTAVFCCGDRIRPPHAGHH